MPAPFAFRVCAYTTGKEEEEEEEVPKFIPGGRLQKDGNMAPPRRWGSICFYFTFLAKELTV